mgnify:CR=1 FL=1|tara:strand:+ start:2139 stop:2687 length:549 start_codon:yes stop_codon:yes gene_type:complete
MKKILLLLLIPFLSFGQDAEIYKVIKTVENVEFREYVPLLFISYTNRGKDNTPNSSFRVLANYIFGYNDADEEIAMTSPVVIRLFNNNEMLFRMPKQYTTRNIPTPNNPDIKFVETNCVQKAVIQYSGYTNTLKEKIKIEELKKILNAQGIQHNHKFELFVYDSPYKLFNRRNEISVDILKD